MLPTAVHKMTHSTPVKNYLVCSPKIPSTAVRFCRHVMQNSMSFIKSFFLSKQSSETPQISVQTQNSQIGRFNVYIIALNLTYMEKRSNKYKTHLPQQCHNPKWVTFSGETFKGFEVPLILCKSNNDTTSPQRRVFANCFVTLCLLKLHLQMCPFCTNGSKIDKFWAVTLLSQMSDVLCKNSSVSVLGLIE